MSTHQATGTVTLPVDLPNCEELCSHCQCFGHATTIRFPRPAPTVRLITTTLNNVVASKECALCRLVVTAVARAWTPFPLFDANGPPMEIQINYSALFRENPDMGINVRFLGAPNLQDLGQLFDPRIRLLIQNPDQVPSGRDGMEFGRKIQLDHCDSNLYREWYFSCLQRHGAYCEISRNEPLTDVEWYGGNLVGSYYAQATAMFVLDLTGMCIRRATPDCRYIALSYVWGLAPFTRLLSNNLNAFAEEGSLQRIKMPRTIQDAIIVTQNLGERFLWIDALCIIQDDPVAKLHQITQMDKIFNRAALTIASVAGEDVHSGLCGVGRGSRNRVAQHIEVIRGHEFVVMNAPLPVLLERSKWHNRGWTYQEFMLSKRFLLFTADQAYFLCNLQSCSEEHHLLWSGQRPMLEPPLPGTKEAWKHPLWAIDEGHNINSTRNFRFPENYFTYQKLVASFTRRHFTHEGDALKALTGILAAMVKFRPDKYICGLPTNLLEWALMWVPRGEIQPRGRSETGRAFPSWSWIGWTGPMQLPKLPLPHMLTLTITDWEFFAPTKWSVDPSGLSSDPGNSQDTHKYKTDVSRKKDATMKRIGRKLFGRSKDNKTSSAPSLPPPSHSSFVLRVPHEVGDFLPYQPRVQENLSGKGIHITRWRDQTEHQNGFDDRFLKHQITVDVSEPLIESGFLRFSTTFAKFEIQGAGSSARSRLFNNEVNLYKIMHKGLWAGSVWLAPSMGKEKIGKRNVSAQMIFLSRSTFQLAEDEGSRDYIYDMEKLGDQTKDDFWFANVMWIEWVNQEQRFARRVAFGQIHGTCWFQFIRLEKRFVCCEQSAFLKSC